MSVNHDNIFAPVPPVKGISVSVGLDTNSRTTIALCASCRRELATRLVDDDAQEMIPLDLAAGVLAGAMAGARLVAAIARGDEPARVTKEESDRLFAESREQLRSMAAHR